MSGGLVFLGCCVCLFRQGSVLVLGWLSMLMGLFAYARLYAILGRHVQCCCVCLFSNVLR